MLATLSVGADLSFSVKEYLLETGEYYRWRIESQGGEEFMLLLPDLGLPAAALRAEALRGAGFWPLVTPATLALLPLGPEAGMRAALAQKWRNRLNRAERAGLKLRETDLTPDHWILTAEAAQARARGYRGLPPAFSAAFARANPIDRAEWGHEARFGIVTTGKAHLDTLEALRLLGIDEGIARELGVDGWELRRRNFIPAAKFPYRTVTGELYDVGDFDRVLSHAEASCDRAGFAARKAASEEHGKLRGIGLCYYIESILGDPSEGARVTFDEDGGVSLFVGTQSNGQGHETVYARFLADQTGIPMERIRVVQGDSDLIAKGGGTGGSRSVTVQANVTLTAVAGMVAAFTPFLADSMGVEESAVRFDNETFRAEGSNLTPTMLEAAEMARAAGRDDLLRHEARDRLPGRSYPNGAHVAEVEVDPETGTVTVERYTVVDDFGNLINPLLAEGQVHGGVAQGIGQAVTEHVVHDEDGQLLTATFMDYGMPRADILPMFRFETEPVPSTANPMGMKGCGEAGTVGAMAAMGNAVQDALWDRGVRQADMPFTPLRVWSMLRDASQTAA